MGWEVRPAAVEDVPDLVRADWAAFGNQPTEAQIEDARSFLEIERALVAVEGERVVGTTAALTLEVTVPGPVPVPSAGVTYVGVLPTHRRQGILTALMDRLLDDASGRGEPLAALLASESTIYRRFGYGVAVMSSSVEVDRPYARLRRPVDVAGRTRMVDRNGMEKALPPVFESYRRHQPGEVRRSPSYWAGRLRDPEPRRGGANARFAVLWEGDGGGPKGYVTYRILENWGHGLPGHTLAIEELIALDPNVRAGLWQYCFDVDLVGVVSANVAPDEPLWWMLTDPRRLRVTQVKDSLWIRILDVATALAARAYATDAELVIEVVDQYRPEVAGRYRLSGGGGGAGSCRRTDALPDLVLDVAELGSVYLGGVRLSTLARAGLVSEMAPGAVAGGDAMFATAPGPFTYTTF